MSALGPVVEQFPDPLQAVLAGDGVHQDDDVGPVEVAAGILGLAEQPLPGVGTGTAAGPGTLWNGI